MQENPCDFISKVYKSFVLAILFLVLVFEGTTQNTPDTSQLYSVIPHFIKETNKKIESVNSSLDKKTLKYIKKFIKQENELKRKLLRFDSLSAKDLFSSEQSAQYMAIINKIKQGSWLLDSKMAGQYMPYIDSLHGVVSFMNEPSEIFKSGKILPGQLQNTFSQIKEFESKIQNAERINEILQQRKEQIKRHLIKYKKLPKQIAKTYNGYSKQVYFYSQEVKEFKNAVNEPDKFLLLALKHLQKVPAFTSFMNSNSFLAGIFNVPGNYTKTENVIGLQTRAQINSLLDKQLGFSGNNAEGIMKNQAKTVQQKVSQADNVIAKLKGGGKTIEVRDYTPNQQHTKKFWKRLEYGTNLQTLQSTNYFPISTDLGLSIGYKINDKSILGIGASYKIGWGKDISHINVTSNGVGFRSFLDVKVKGGIYASGGFEYNYQKPFSAIAQLYSVQNWTKSGMIGVSKTISLKTKFFKASKVQLLWDFLSYDQLPRTQPFKFRIGYNF